MSPPFDHGRMVESAVWHVETPGGAALPLWGTDDWRTTARPPTLEGGHAKSREGGTTELDAVGPLILQQLVRDAIESLIDDDELAVAKLAEESERTILASITATMGGAG